MKEQTTETKYWQSLEQLEATPEFLDKAQKEFPEPAEQKKPSEMERRDFLKVMGASMLMATAACSRRPVEKLIPYVNQPEEITPGVANWYTSTCGGCEASCGILVKTREARPIKLEGNKDSPIGSGGLCGKGQASLLNLYDPDRLKNPVRLKRGQVSPEEVSWEDFDSELKLQLANTSSQGKKIYLLTGSISSPSTKKLIGEFLQTYPGAKHVSYDSIVPEEVALGQQLAYGQKVTPHYRFDKAKLIVSFGADFLGTWLSPVQFSKDFSSGRRVAEGTMSRFITFESALSLSGSNADEYHGIKPGDELTIALALAHEIIVKKQQSRFSGSADVANALSGYSVDSVAKDTGVHSGILRKAAHSLWQNRGQGLVLGGPIKGKNAVALQVVVNLLNSALENDGVTVDAVSSPSNQADSSYADLLTLVKDMKAGTVGALLIENRNPSYTLPEDSGFTEALKRVPLVVSFADRLNETTNHVDYALALSHYFEAWNDANPRKGIYSITQPVINPLYKTRSFQESLIQWSHVSEKNWHQYIQNNWQNTLFTTQGGVQTFEAFWDNTLKVGVLNTLPQTGGDSRVHVVRNFQTGSLSSLPPKNGGDAPYYLALYPSVALYDGRSANNVWLQELPDPLSKITWDNYLSIAPSIARELKLKEGDVVRLRGDGFNDYEFPVHVQPKLHPKTIMIALGYGRTKAGRVGNGVGINTYPLQKTTDAFVEWSGLPVEYIIKTGITLPFAMAQMHQTTEGRPIIKETTFKEFKKDPHSGNEGHHGPVPSMWPKHKYEGHRWGMAIDLNACTGCGSCMIGCQSENNVMPVGKEQVKLGRIMHWLRIDRYYSGDEKNPDLTFQLMLCQQCENAPCETVCPVLATVHNDEGLNVQIYNRCVGTRYCLNNCPYKIRRFNYFDYYKEFIEPLNLALNPDVTTRTRGIMEKCTFCIQRIQTAKDVAKDEGRKVGDGDVVMACQQSCPTDAITFGDINDKKSEVSKKKKSPRGYYVFQELNAQPQVKYLLKVRNKNVGA